MPPSGQRVDVTHVHYAGKTASCGARRAHVQFDNDLSSRGNASTVLIFNLLHRDSPARCQALGAFAMSTLIIGILG
jgi:hypothetical protein